MFNSFIVRKLLESKLKNIPEAEREKFIVLITKNPELFKTIALEIKAEIDSEKGEMAAAMEVFERHKDELEGLIGDNHA